MTVSRPQVGDLTIVGSAPEWRRWSASRRIRLAMLVACGLALEAVLVFGVLLPLSIWRFPEVFRDERPLATALGLHQGPAIVFGLTISLSFVLLGCAAWLARTLHGRAATAVVLIFSVLFIATIVPINPVGAHDIYHNVADSRTIAIYHDNPTAIPPNVYLDDAFYPYVVAWQDFPSVYGPVWYAVTMPGALLAGDGLWANVIAQKVLTSLFLFGVTVLAMLTAGRLRPGAMAQAAILVGWNPLLIFDTAGNAHNDVVMVFFGIAMIYAITRRWWPVVFPLLALAVATKYVFALLGPLVLLWMWRRRDVPRREVLASLLLGVAVGLLAYAPFYNGKETVAAFQRQTAFNTSSPSALLQAVFMDWFGLDEVTALSRVKLVVGPVFLAIYAVLLLRIPRDPGVVILARTGFWAVFWLFVVATWWFWPWYLMMLVPLAAVLPGGRSYKVALVFSASAMLMYVPYFWYIDGDWMWHHIWTATVAFLPPVVTALALWLHSRRRRQPLGSLAGD